MRFSLIKSDHAMKIAGQLIQRDWRFDYMRSLLWQKVIRIDPGLVVQWWWWFGYQ
jgi:hypothetical protein